MPKHGPPAHAGRFRHLVDGDVETVLSRRIA
jgi:hypothetical protein